MCQFSGCQAIAAIDEPPHEHSTALEHVGAAPAAIAGDGRPAADRASLPHLPPPHAEVQEVALSPPLARERAEHVGVLHAEHEVVHAELAGIALDTGRPTGHAGTAPSPVTRLEAADLRSRDDLERLLRDFYGRVLADPLLRHVFVDVVDMDLEAHLPRITDFWQKVLLGTGGYDGQAMAVHRRVHQLVSLTSVHFERWLDLWCDTVAEHCAGPVAERAVAHAERMAAVFLRNLLEPRRPARSLPIVSGASGRG